MRGPTAAFERLLARLGMTVTRVQCRGSVSMYSFAYKRHGLGRRGWALLRVGRGRPSVELSLVVADEGEWRSERKDWVGRWPRTLIGRLGVVRARRGVLLRLVDRFELAGHVDDDRRRGEFLMGNAAAIRTLLDGGFPRQDGALANMAQIFQEYDLGELPLPLELHSRLLQLGGWWWGTSLVDPFEMYRFNRLAQVLIDSWDGRPLFSLGHDGHGVNSFAFSLLSSRGPICAFAQVHYGGVYGDPVWQAAECRAVFGSVQTLLDRVPKAQMKSAPGHVLLYSNFRRSARLVDVKSGEPREFDNRRLLFAAAAEIFL